MTTGTLLDDTRTYVRKGFNVKARGHVAEWLRYKMRVRRLNIQATAELIGVSPATVSRIKDGNRDPGFDFVLRFCEAFSVPIEAAAYTDPPLLTTDGTEQTKPGR